MAKEEMKEERRLTNRITFRSGIKYGRPNPEYRGNIFNLSAGGIGIRGKKLYPPNSTIVVVKDNIDRFVCKVVWSSELISGKTHRMGIEFLGSGDRLLQIYQQKVNQ